MKLWLLDADVIIKFLELDVFDRLIALHQVRVASTVIEEVKYFYRDGKRIQINFRSEYINTGRVIETTASVREITTVLNRLPALKQQAMHAGELESLAVLARETALVICTFDAAAIRTLPFLEVADRAISGERLLQSSGLTLAPGLKLDPRLTEGYFKNNLELGRLDFLMARET